MVLILNGKTVLITGGANGIGSNVVRLLAAEGVKNVTLLDVDPNRGIKLQDELNAEHKRDVVKFIQCDVSVDAQLFGAFDLAFETNGYIDVVINNAGLFYESGPEAVRKTTEVNFVALVNLTMKAMEAMRIDKGGNGGTIVNISSIAGLSQSGNFANVYKGTKSAVLLYSVSLGNSNLCLSNGVKVVTICFGLTDTDIFDKTLSDGSNSELDNILMTRCKQSPLSAAHGLIEVLKIGEGGTTWLIQKNKSPENITDNISRAYAIMSEPIQ